MVLMDTPRAEAEAQLRRRVVDVQLLEALRRSGPRLLTLPILRGEDALEVLSQRTCEARREAAGQDLGEVFLRDRRPLRDLGVDASDVELGLGVEGRLAAIAGGCGSVRHVRTASPPVLVQRRPNAGEPESGDFRASTWAYGVRRAIPECGRRLAQERLGMSGAYLPIAPAASLSMRCDGSSTIMVLPPPSLRSAQIFPWCASTNALHSANPSPAP